MQIQCDLVPSCYPTIPFLSMSPAMMHNIFPELSAKKNPFSIKSFWSETDIVNLVLSNSEKARPQRSSVVRQSNSYCYPKHKGVLCRSASGQQVPTPTPPHGTRKQEAPRGEGNNLSNISNFFISPQSTTRKLHNTDQVIMFAFFPFVYGNKIKD